MEKLKHHSIIISLILYFGISLLIAEMAYIGISHCIDQTMINLLNPKPDSLILQGNTQITLFHDASDYDAEPYITDPNLFQLLKIVKSILPIALFGLCILLAAIIFYKRKLKKQIDLLQFGMEKVSKQDLNFELRCDCKDEIGMLCNSFEHMRVELQNTFEKLWNAEEKQNLLLRAFSHDLRTPLTILKGNNDLIRHILGNEMEQKNIYRCLTLNDDAIKRIERYTEALKNYKNIDQWELNNTSVKLKDLKENLIHQCQLWDKEVSKKTEVLCDTDEVSYFDPILIQLVLDRIIENAFRFAKTKIVIRIHKYNETIIFTVEDDGEGFSPEALKSAPNLFYSTDKARGHSGMGLAIASKLLQICNSHLSYGNTENGATVSFSIKST